MSDDLLKMYQSRPTVIGNVASATSALPPQMMIRTHPQLVDVQQPLVIRVGTAGLVGHVTVSAPIEHQLFAQKHVAAFGKPQQPATPVRKVKIVSPPGHWMLRLAEFFFSRKSFERRFRPIVDDLRFEYNEALADDRPWKARWIRLRHAPSFIDAFFRIGALVEFLKWLLSGDGGGR